MSELTIEQTEQLIRALHDTANYTAATELVLRHFGPQIQRFAIGKLRDRVAADEAFSEFSHDLWRGMPSFRWECSVRAWSYMLARNALVRCAKRARKQRQREVALSEHPSLALNEPEPADTRASAPPRQDLEAPGCLTELYRTLPVTDQALLRLRITRHLGWKQIAQALSEGRTLDDAALEQESARLRKRFQLVKDRLRRNVQNQSFAGC